MDLAEGIENLSGPITKLIDCVSSAIGKAYEPRRIKKLADAKNYEINKISEAVRNNSDVPIVYDEKGVSIDTSNFEEIAKRASSRLAYQEISKQQNIESVVDNAYTSLEGKTLESEESVDKDWMLRFINSIEDISNEDMQKIWGDILAGEIVRPHSFSLRTLEILKNMSKHEAEVFQKVCRCVLMNEYVYNNENVLGKYGVTYNEILQLDDCGLINSSSTIYRNIHIGLENTLIISTDDYIMLGKCKENNSTISYQVFALSQSGKELYKIVGNKLSEDYLFEVAGLIKDRNADVEVSLHAIKSTSETGYEYDDEDLLSR